MHTSRVRIAGFATSLVAVLCVLAPSFAAGDGKPAGARAGDSRPGAAEQALERGEYAAALKLAAAAKARDPDDLVAARAELATGRWDEAARRLEALAARAPRMVEARVELGRLFHATGRLAEEKAVWNRFFDDYEQGRVDKTSARELTAVAIAARGLGAHQDASDLFRDAVAADPKYPLARREWGEIFLEKYAAGEAEADARAALDLSPDDPDAHVLLARVKIAQSYDAAGAEREIDRALQRNPRHAGALALRGELMLDEEDYAGAEQAAQAILAQNARDSSARVLRAAIRRLRGDGPGFDAERAAALATNPKDARFFHGVAEFLVKQHRYEEANLLEEEALKIDPRDPVVLAAIGQNQLRLGGREAAGLSSLRAAFSRDRFNVRTYNLLNLFETVIPKDYEFLDAPPFRVRVPRAHRDVLARVLPPMIAAEWKELTARYGFTPEGPLTIELYADPSHYAVRTIGLPGLDALGVTFGKVVTGGSPALGRFNWGMMLWHEIGHVFSIQLSKARVPRWFTEGLAEYETGLRDPDWVRRTHAELYAALQGGKLHPVSELNRGFVRARSVAAMVVAYHESAEMVAFLARRFGFPKIVAALKLYAAGQETPAVLRAVTGMSTEELDGAFREDLEKRLAIYSGQLVLRASAFADLDGLAEEAKAHPDDPRALSLYALALLHDAHDLPGAAAQLARAQATGKASKEALLAAAEVMIARNEPANAQKTLQLLLSQGGDGYDVRARLGALHAREGRVADAERELALAKRFDPDASAPYVALAKLYLKEKRGDDAIRELDTASHLEIHDLSIQRALVAELAARGRNREVREAAARAAWIAPADPKLREAAARAALAMKDLRGAATEIEMGLAGHPDSPGPLIELRTRALGGR